MPRSVEALVEANVLIWARKSIGYSLEEAAKKIRVDVDKLKEWEEGHSLPSIAQLRNIAKHYKRPLVVFFLPKPPNEFDKTFDAMRDFRRFAVDLESESSTALRLEVRKARDRRDIVIELTERMRDTFPEFTLSASLNDDPEQVGREIRNTLGITYDVQKSWRDPYEALRTWKSLIENQGVLIFQTGQYQAVELNEMRACSIQLRPYSIIILNAKDSPNGRVFSLVHELTHLMLNQEGVCDLAHYSTPNTQTQRIEAFCNYVAGAATVPMPQLLNQPSVIRNIGNDDDWEEHEINTLSNTFSISREVILRRLLIAGRISESYYNEKRQEYIEQYRTSREQSSGFAVYYRQVVNRHGNSYIKTVLNAYYQEAITANTLLTYLGTKIKHVPNIERAVMGYSTGLGEAP